jgi:hypothetical protein
LVTLIQVRDSRTEGSTRFPKPQTTVKVTDAFGRDKPSETVALAHALGEQGWVSAEAAPQKPSSPLQKVIVTYGSRAILEWLLGGGSVIAVTLGQRVRDEAIDALVDAVKTYLRRRRRRPKDTDEVVIYGPNGEVLRRVEV